MSGHEFVCTFYEAIRKEDQVETGTVAVTMLLEVNNSGYIVLKPQEIVDLKKAFEKGHTDHVVKL